MTLNVSLTPHLEAFIRRQVVTGRYQSASEVVRSALRLMEEESLATEAQLAWLTQEIDRGLQSGAAEPVTPAFWDRLRRKLQTQPSSRSDDARTNP